MVKRLADTLLAPDPLISSTPYVNLAQGGSMAIAPPYDEYNSETLYIKQHVVPIVFDIPRAFANTPQGQTFASMFKSIFEKHPTRITGLKSTTNVEFTDTQYDGAGNKIYAPVNATIEESVPVFSYTERYGRPFQKLFDYWIRYHIMDPITKMPGSVTYSDPATRPGDYLLDQWTMTMLFIVTDPTNRYVDEAYLCMGMAPKSSGPKEAKRDKTASLDKLEYDIEFTATTQIGIGVNALAAKVLNLLDYRNANPILQAAAMEEIAPDVAALGNGYIEQAKKIGDNAITQN